jgi:hypothetical protein
MLPPARPPLPAPAPPTTPAPPRSYCAKLSRLPPPQPRSLSYSSMLLRVVAVYPPAPQPVDTVDASAGPSFKPSGEEPLPLPLRPRL